MTSLEEPDWLGLGLAFFDIVMAFILMVITQISTRYAGLHGEYHVRSLIRRITYYVVILILLYRAYAIADDHWNVTWEGAITNAVLISSIIFLAMLDVCWEWRRRRRARIIDRIRETELSQK